MEIAKTSHNKGELKFTHREPKLLGKGKTQYASHGLPMWKIGNNPACTTAKIVIASAERLIDRRHF